MRHYDRKPNLFLKRTGFYADCTVGELSNDEGERICYTLEPPYRPPTERAVVGNTAIPEGTYPLKMEYDTTLRYKCLRVGDVKGFKNVRLCFLTKTSSEPHQAKGNILLGCHFSPDEGRLTDSISAFELLNTYYESKRCNHAQLCLEVSSEGFSGRKRESFSKSPVQIERALQDYELQTL